MTDAPPISSKAMRAIRRAIRQGDPAYIAAKAARQARSGTNAADEPAAKALADDMARRAHQRFGKGASHAALAAAIVVRPHRDPALLAAATRRHGQARAAKQEKDLAALADAVRAEDERIAAMRRSDPVMALAEQVAALSRKIEEQIAGQGGDRLELLMNDLRGEVSRLRADSKDVRTALATGRLADVIKEKRDEPKT